MRELIRHHAKLSVDQIKLSMSGEAITELRSAEDCFFTDEETAACVDEAHRHGLRVCSHDRARDSVIQCVEHGVDVIYHGMPSISARVHEADIEKPHIPTLLA